METKRQLKGTRLQAAQSQALDDLYREVDSPSGKFEFYTQADTENFSDGSKNLAKAELIHPDQICSLREEIKYKARAWFERCHEKMPVGIDCETEGLSPYTNEFIGIGIVYPKQIEALDLDLVHSKTAAELEEQSSWFECYFLVAPTESDKYLTYLSEIKSLLATLNPEVKWDLHNAKFDMLWLYWKTGVLLQTIDDSMCMAYLLGERSLAIDKLAPKYLGRFPTTLGRITGKDKKEIDKAVLRAIPIQEFADYCAEDCIEGILLSVVLMDKLFTESTDTSDLVDLYDNYDKYSIHAAVWAEHKGVMLDWEKMSDVGLTLEAEIEAIKEEVAILMGTTLEESKKICGSAQELSKVLYEDLGLPTQGIKQGKKGLYSTDKDALNILRFLHPLPEAIFDYRTLSKLKGTYVDGLHKHNVDGIVHTTYNNCRTDTGRWSSDEPNLQNIPNPAKSATGKLLRQSFIARSGKVLVKADYSQFELRIVAHFSGDPYLIGCYEKGIDVHSAVTCLLFDLDYETFNPDSDKEQKKKRTIVKNINFGLIYGMTAHKLFKMAKDAKLDYTLDQCLDIMNRYWSRLPGVRNWMATNRLKTIRDGYTETIFGRRRYFTFQHPYLKALKGKPIDLTYENWLVLEQKGVVNDFTDQQSFRAIGNAPIQGSNADCIRRAVGECFEKWFGTEVNLLLQVHDELVLECPESEAMQVKGDLKQIMEGCASGLRVPIVADPTVALNWGDC